MAAAVVLKKDLWCGQAAAMPNLNLLPRCRRCSSVQHSTQECPRVHPPAPIQALPPPPAPIQALPPPPAPIQALPPTPAPIQALPPPPAPIQALPPPPAPIQALPPPPAYVVEERNLKTMWTKSNWSWMRVCAMCKLPRKTCACNLPAKRIVKKLTK